MPEKPFIVDLDQVDFDNVIADINEIRKYNLQRHEMEQLTAIVLHNQDDNTCVGYKDIADDEFWVRGHMPDMPLMPGVIMCEAAAQLASFFVQKGNLMPGKVIGFGGLEDVRFRGIVVPPCRLIVMCKLTKIRPSRMMVCEFQGIVNEKIVVEGEIKGIALPVEALKGQDSDSS